ncbi:MAG: hypothetical protein KJ649_00545 [Proteobacteria bacterium]|nr:hypothetical protein [Pseudomonadota bacterium]
MAENIMIMKRIADDDTTGRNRRAGKDPAGGSGKRPYCFMIHRYSSRRSPLKDFLATQLQGARRYDRIAGFFSSSLSYPIYKVNDHACLLPESVN